MRANISALASLARRTRRVYISRAMDHDRLLRELTDFLRIPSVSTSPAHNADCRAAAEWVAGELRRLGCREAQFLARGTRPVVGGAGPGGPGAPGLLRGR